MGPEEKAMKVIVILAMLSISTAAQAYDCSDLQAVVRQHGEKAAIKVARDAGIPPSLIRLAIKTCLRK
jgi:hypothetical protein